MRAENGLEENESENEDGVVEHCRELCGEAFIS